MPPAGKPKPKTFMRGALPSPAHRIMSAPRHVPQAAPPQFAVIPPTLSMWGNDQYGDCVSAEEAAAKAAYSVSLGMPEQYVTDAACIAWATQYGYLDGATLTDVMSTMLTDGMPCGGAVLTDGPAQTVDWTTPASLASAISQGPVKIGIDADALPGTAGNQMGWYAVGGTPGQFPNEDHCVGLWGYGPAGWLYQQLAAVYPGVTLPSGLDPATQGYLLYTWSTIGFVDAAWLLSTCAEAWLRVPTTPQQPTPAPGPTPTPTPTPTPGPTPTPTPIGGWTGTLCYVDGSLISAGALPAPAPTPAAPSTPSLLPPSASKLPGANWPGVFDDLAQLSEDLAAGDWAAVGADVGQILADLSANPTTTQYAQMSSGMQRRVNATRQSRAAKKS